MFPRITLLALCFYALPAPAYFRLLTMHSQSSTIPTCPSGFSTMWSGYSLLGNFNDPYWPSGQDLGSAGSCVEKFIPLALIECTNDFCDYKSGGDLTTWLTTSNSQADINKDMSNASQKAEIVARISRCVVCQGKKPVVVKHSFSLTIPDCPSGWSSLWSGYSLGMVSFDAGRGTGMNMGDTGSCLPTFDPAPQMNCQEDGRCKYDGTAHAIWLLNHDTETDKSQKTPGLSPANTGRIGRCNVCVKN